jgi:hypothetical protein
LLWCNLSWHVQLELTYYCWICCILYRSSRNRSNKSFKIHRALLLKNGSLLPPPPLPLFSPPVSPHAFLSLSFSQRLDSRANRAQRAAGGRRERPWGRLQAEGENGGRGTERVPDRWPGGANGKRMRGQGTLREQRPHGAPRTEASRRRHEGGLSGGGDPDSCLLNERERERERESGERERERERDTAPEKSSVAFPGLHSGTLILQLLYVLH